MAEYVIVFLALMGVSLGLYWLYERYLNRTHKPDAALYVEALRDLLDGKPESAFGKLRQVVAADAGNVDAYLRLGQILREHKKPDRALQVHKDLTLRSGLDREQKVAILTQLVLDYGDLGEADTAQAALRELIALAPEDRWAHSHLLKLQEQAGQWDEAYDTAAKLLKLESSKSKKLLARFRYKKGMQFVEQREYHKARIHLKEALGLDPQHAAAYLAIGDSYAAEGRHEDAVAFWNKLITAVPEQAHRVIGRLKKALFELGRYGDIAEICLSILEHSPKDFEARMTLAEFHEKKGDLDRAEELLMEVLDDQPDSVKPVLELTRIYAQKGDPRKIGDLLSRLERKRKTMPRAAQDEIVDTSLIGI